MSRTLALLALLALASVARTEPDVAVRDDELTARATLVVIGRLQQPPRYVPYPDGSGWEYHGDLRVIQVLKGKVDGETLPVVFHHGLDPVVGGVLTRGDLKIDMRLEGQPRHERIEIIATGAGSEGRRLLADARADNIWFLRRPGPDFPKAASRDRLGIVDGHDLQPADLAPYFRAFLAEDPEAAIRAILPDMPAVGARAMDFLTVKELERIERIEEHAHRAERLVPYFVADTHRPHHAAVVDALRRCGAAAGPYLLVVHARPDATPFLRGTIAGLWADAGYRAAFPALLAATDRIDDRFAQLRTTGWTPAAAWRGAHAADASELVASLRAIHRVGDPRALPLLRRVAERWKGDREVEGVCGAALQDLAKEEDR
jgi:hypothetical protein